MSRYRTFADILAANRFSNHGGATCRFCHEWDRETTYYAVRHVVCRECCKARGNQVLPSVLRAEAKARAYLKKFPTATDGDVRFIAYLSGATEGYVRSVMGGQS